MLIGNDTMGRVVTVFRTVATMTAAVVALAALRHGGTIAALAALAPMTRGPPRVYLPASHAKIL